MKYFLSNFCRVIDPLVCTVNMSKSIRLRSAGLKGRLSMYHIFRNYCLGIYYMFIMRCL